MRGEGFKKGRNRVISFVMAIAMVLTLVTVAPVTAQAAGVTNITIHFKMIGDGEHRHYSIGMEHPQRLQVVLMKKCQAGVVRKQLCLIKMQRMMVGIQ